MTNNQTKLNNIFRTKVLGKLEEKITIINIASDHKIIIFQNIIPIPGFLFLYTLSFTRQK